MPISANDFKKTGLAGCKWDRRTRRAFFDVHGPSGRKRSVLKFESVEAAKTAFPAFRASAKAAIKAEQNQEALPAQGAAPPERTPCDGITLEDYADSHWDAFHGKCGPSAKATNASSYRTHLKPFFGKMLVSKIEESHCEDFAADMRAKEKSPYTTNLALRLLRKILHHARRRDAKVELPKSFQFVKEDLLNLEMTDSEQARFLAAFDDETGFRAFLSEKQGKGKVVRSERFGFKERRFGGGLRGDSDAAEAYFERFRRSRSIFVAALDLGYRLSDWRLLKRASVDLTRGLVTITTTKTKKRVTIPLSDRCREAIASAMLDEVASSEFVFATEEGKPYAEVTIRRYFAVAKKLAGITRRCRLNDLRHTFASNLASDGFSAFEIRDALGHTTVRMSERYAKPNERSLERMREAMNARQKVSASATSAEVSETHRAS